MLRKATELSPEQRLALEGLLGRAISDQETVSVRAFEPAPVSAAERAEILAGLDAYFARIDAKRPAMADAEADAVINEALRSTRPNYRPIR
jgi:hypothetical protein